MLSLPSVVIILIFTFIITFILLLRFKNWFKKILFPFITISLIIGGIILVFFSSEKRIQDFFIALGQTFLSVGLILLIFQIPILRDDIFSFIKETLLNDEALKNKFREFLAEGFKNPDFLKNLKPQILKEIVINTLGVYSHIENAEDFFEEILYSFKPFYYKSLSRVLKIRTDDTNSRYTIREVIVKNEYCITEKVETLKVANFNIILDEEEDFYIKQFNIKINKDSYTMPKEYLNKIIKVQKTEDKSKIYSLNKEVFIDFCKKKNIPLHLSKNDTVKVSRTEVRKVLFDNPTMFKATHFVDTCNIIVHYPSDKINIEVHIFHSKKEELDENTLEGTLSLTEVKSLHKGGGFIIFLKKKTARR